MNEVYYKYGGLTKPYNYDILPFMVNDESEIRALALRLNNAMTQKRLDPAAKNSLNDQGVQESIVRASGIPASEMADRPFMVAVLLDDTYSMNRRVNPQSGHTINYDLRDPESNVDALRHGFNTIMDVLKVDSGCERIYTAAFLMSKEEPLQPWRPLADTVRLDTENFLAQGSNTPLYRRTLIALGSLVDKEQEARNARKTPQGGALFIITDGANNGSDDPSKTASLVKVTRAVRENTVTMVAIDNGEADYRAEAAAMGIDDILTIRNIKAEISRILGRYAEFLRLATVPGNIPLLTAPGQGFKRFIEGA